MPPRPTAKISLPRLVRPYARLRLFRALNKAKTSPVTWVCGPPGSGKTTLVASYLAAGKRSKIWYHVDAGDADVATFFSYLRLAVEQAARRKRPPLPLLTPEYLADVPTFTRTFFRNLWERLPHPSVLVFDNYHDLGDDAALHALIQVGLSEIPDGSRVIFISRHEPHPAFAPRRVSQAMTVMDGAALPFTKKEVAGLIALRRHGGKLSKAAQSALYRQTDGWVAAIVLMLDRLDAHGGVSGETAPAVHEKTREAVFDYLLVEVWDRLPEAVRDFLLRSAFLPALTAPMAARIAERHPLPRKRGRVGERAGFAERTLKDLARRNFFIASSPDGTYRYHDLFRAFLLARARETLTPDDLTQARLSAAMVLEDAGRMEEAAELFREANDWPGMTRLILKAAPLLLAQGRHKVLEGWIAALPEEVSHRHPWLLYRSGCCRALFDPLAGRVLFEKAYRLFDEERNAPDVVGLFSAWCGVVETFLYEWGDVRGLDPWIALMVDKPAHPFPSMEVEARVAANMSFALTYRQPTHPAVRRWVERSLTLAAGIDRADIAIQAIGHAAFYYAAIGEWAKVGRVIDLSRSRIASDRSAPYEIIHHHGLEALHGWTSHSQERCIAAVETGLSLARTRGVHLLDHWLLLHGVHGSFTTGDLQTGSQYLLRQREEISSERRRLVMAAYHYMVAWEAWLEGDLPKALEFARRSLDLATEAGSGFHAALGRLAVAQVLLAQGRRSDAEAHLQEVDAFGREMGSHMLIYMTRLLEAQLKSASGDEKGLLAALAEAFGLGRQQGYFNAPWWNAPMMATFCMVALQHDIEVEYAQYLIRKRNLFPDSPPLTCENWPWPIEIFTLGRSLLLRDDRPLEATGKAKKQLELLYTLVAFGEQGASEEKLAEALWPEAEGDKAHWALEKTVSRLRRLLQRDDAIALHLGCYQLRHVWSDAWAVTQLLEEAGAAMRQPPNETRKGEVRGLSEKIDALYKGKFLGLGAPPSLVLHRERLHDRYLRHVRELGRYWERTEAWEEAQRCYQSALTVDPTAEIVAQRLIVLYQKFGRQAEADAVLERLRKAPPSTGHA